MKYLISCLLLYFVCHSQAQTVLPVTISLAEVVINGSSNINEFKLFLNSKQTGTEMEALDEDKSSLKFLIPVKSIKASNWFILHDFRSLVEAEKYPEIKLTINKSQIKSIIEDGEVQNIYVSIFIAGVKNTYQIPVYWGCLGKNKNFITGVTNLNLQDFNLSLNKKMGLIQVNKEVCINFKINFG